jgi:hypothetical protein
MFPSEDLTLVGPLIPGVDPNDLSSYLPNLVKNYMPRETDSWGTFNGRLTLLSIARERGRHTACLALVALYLVATGKLFLRRMGHRCVALYRIHMDH